MQRANSVSRSETLKGQGYRMGQVKRPEPEAPRPLWAAMQRWRMGMQPLHMQAEAEPEGAHPMQPG